MMTRVTRSRLGALLKSKRRERGLGLRSAAHDAGLSPSTLSRLERGQFASVPDTETLTKLSTWLRVSVEQLLEHVQPPGRPPELSTLEFVEGCLKSDTALSPDAAERLAKMFSLLYEEFRKSAVASREQTDTPATTNGEDKPRLNNRAVAHS
jgi:transcriptional regulator with XRE-family HTH domain